jgi:hypothetical protein
MPQEQCGPVAKTFHTRLVGLRQMTMLGALIVGALAEPVMGSSVGFQEYLKHEHNQSIVLPRLYEPQPSHVPVLSNQELIRLWETNQFSPILRNPQIEVQLYEAVSQRRSLNPVQFDRQHPTLGHLLRDPEFFKYAMSLYNLDTARFVHYHHHLIPVIRGYAMVMATAPEAFAGTAPSPPPVLPPQAEIIFPPPQTLTVPEPASVVSMTAGIGCVAAWILTRHRARQGQRPS